MNSLLARLATRFLSGVAIGLAVALGLAYGLSIPHTPGLLGNLVAAGTASTAFLFAASSKSGLEAVSRAIFGVVAGGAVHAVGARLLEHELPWPLLGAEAGLPVAEIPLLYAPVIGALAATLIAALPPRKAP